MNRYAIRFGIGNDYAARMMSGDNGIYRFYTVRMKDGTSMHCDAIWRCNDRNLIEQRAHNTGNEVLGEIIGIIEIHNIDMSVPTSSQALRTRRYERKKISQRMDWQKRLIVIAIQDTEESLGGGGGPSNHTGNNDSK